MATLHSLLALYGALDDAVTALDDPTVTEIVENYLPGSTSPENRGWFGEIRNFVRRLSVDPDQTEFPTRTAALRDFAEISRRAVDSDEPPMSPIEITRLLYVIGVHWQLAGRAEDERALFADALAVTLPGRPDPEAAGDLLDLLGANFLSGHGFADVIQLAFEQELVSEAVMLYATNATLETDVRSDACGEYAVIKVTYFRDHLPLSHVKDVVDPLNWHLCCPFFCAMAPIPKTPDSYGWSRVLESISTLCSLVPGYRIKTAIKYWKGERPGGAFVNYDLDDDRAKTADDGFTVLDRGYISFDEYGDGVRIRTLKEVKFKGISAFATKMFAIYGGYASIGEHMLIGCALKRPPTAIAWKRSEPTGKPAKQFDPTVCTSAAPAPAPCSCGCQQPVPPAVAEAVDMWADCVTEVSTDYAALVNRWAKCGFDVNEMVEFGSKVSARLATDPFRVMKLLLDAGPQPKGH